MYIKGYCPVEPPCTCTFHLQGAKIDHKAGIYFLTLYHLHTEFVLITYMYMMEKY